MNQHSQPMSRRSRLVVVAALAGLGVALASCAGGGAPDTTEDGAAPAGAIVEGGTLTMSLTGEPGNLDPTLSNTLAASTMYPAFCEALYTDMREGVTPTLAAGEPVFADDGLSATIDIIEATFADGTPMDAEAVKFSMTRHLTLEASQRVNELDAVSSVDVVDDDTVRFNLKYPIAPGVLTSNLASRAGIVVSPTAVEALGDAGFNEAPVCVGGFKFGSRVAQDSVTLVRDENYYDAENVHLDELVYKVIPGASVRLTNLRSGELDVMERVAPADLATLSAETSITLEQFEGLGHMNLIINIGNRNGAGAPPEPVDLPLAQHPELREALALSIDRDAINQVVYNGEYSTACGFMAPSSAFATETNTSCPGFDPERAAQLVDESGVATPIPVELTLNQMPDLRRIGEMIQQMAAEVGFEVTLNVQESTTAASLSQEGDFEVYFNSFTGTADPDMNVSRFFQSDTPTNTGKFIEPELDGLLEAARTEVDPATRSALYDEIHEHITDATASIYLIRPANIIAYDKSLTGLEFRGTGAIVPTHVAFTE